MEEEFTEVDSKKDELFDTLKELSKKPVAIGRERGEAQSDSKTKINNTGVEQWMVALVIGFFIIIGSIVGLLAVPSHIDGLNEDFEGAYSLWNLYRNSPILEEYAPEYAEDMQQIEEEIEFSEGILTALPYLLLLGAIIIFIALLSRYYTPSDTTILTKKYNSKDESSKEILNKRYAKGEITKEEYAQMKKDMEG